MTYTLLTHTRARTHTHTHTQNSQSVSNLTCNTDTGTMFKNLTLQDTNAVSSSTLNMFSTGPDIIAAIYTSFIQQNCGRLQDDDDGCWRRRWRKQWRHWCGGRGVQYCRPIRALRRGAVSGVRMGWLLRLVTGGTGGRGPTTVLKFLVINFSVCLVLLSNCYIIIYCILYGFKFSRWWLYFSKYIYLIFTSNLSPTNRLDLLFC